METLLDFRKPGQHFDFLGINCVVTALHVNVYNRGQSAECDAKFMPTMEAMYLDRNGQICTLLCDQNMLPALKAQNADANITQHDWITTILEIREHLKEDMQPGYKDGVDDMFREMHRRLI